MFETSKPEPGRNEECPCGSGKKYKACCQRAMKMWIFDHPELRDLKDVRARDVQAATEAFREWWKEQEVTHKLPAKIGAFELARIYAEDDEKAKAYVVVRKHDQGYACANCRSFVFRFVWRGRSSDAFCIPCFLVTVKAPEALRKSPERLKGFFYNAKGNLVLDIADVPAPAAAPAPQAVPPSS